MKHSKVVTFAYKGIEIIDKFISNLEFGEHQLALDEFKIRGIFVTHDRNAVLGINVPIGYNEFGDYIITLSDGCRMCIEFENTKHSFGFYHLADVNYSPTVPLGLPELSCEVVRDLSGYINPEHLYTQAILMELSEFNELWNDYRMTNILAGDEYVPITAVLS